MSTKKVSSISNLNNQNTFIPIRESPKNSTKKRLRSNNSIRSLSVPVGPTKPHPPMERYMKSTSNVKNPPLTLINPDDIPTTYKDLPLEHALTREQQLANAINENKKKGRYTPPVIYPNRPARPQSYPIFPLDRFEAENEYIRRKREGLFFNGGKSKKRKLAKRKKKGTRKRSNKKK